MIRIRIGPICNGVHLRSSSNHEVTTHFELYTFLVSLALLMKITAYDLRFRLGCHIKSPIGQWLDRTAQHLYNINPSTRSPCLVE